MKGDRDGQVKRLDALRKKNQGTPFCSHLKCTVLRSCCIISNCLSTEGSDKVTEELEEVKASCERQLDDMRRKLRTEKTNQVSQNLNHPTTLPPTRVKLPAYPQP